MKELEQRIKWLEKGLKAITDHYSYTVAPRAVRNIAQSYLDGEPTTADEYNEDDCMITYVNEGDEVEYKYKEVGKRITFN